jgi:transposase
MLSDNQWERIAPELLGEVGDPGGSGRDNRLFIEAVLWIARTGSPWRDLPEAFGKWFTGRWAQKGVWDCVFKALCALPSTSLRGAGLSSQEAIMACAILTGSPIRVFSP